MSSTDLENVELNSWQADTFTLDVELAKPHEENIFATDYYEILRVSPQADEDTQFEVGVEPVTPESFTLTFIASEEQNSDRIGEIEQTDIKVEEPSDQNVEVAQGLVPVVEATGLAELVKRAKYLLCGHTPESLTSHTIVLEDQNSDRTAEVEQTDIKVEEPSDQNVEVAQGLVPVVEATGLAELVAPESLTLNTIAMEDLNSDRIGEIEQSDITAEEPWDENLEVAQGPIPIEEATALAERVPPELLASNTIAPKNQNSDRIAEIEQTDIKAEETEEALAAPEQGTGYEVGAEAQERQAGNSEDSHSNELVSPHASAAQLTEESQPNAEVTPESTRVSRMNNSMKAIAEQAGGVAVCAEKRVILSMGGKGGVGKTSVMTGLSEWFEENQIPVTMLDLDIENKARGSLTHFFGGRVPKINIHTPAGLDAFVDHLGVGAPVILADMGAGAGQVTSDWFDKMYPDVAEAGIAFTAIGIVTSDPASVESVLNWAEALQDRVAYVIVENSLSEHADFSYWHENEEAEEFRKRFQPDVIRLDYRLSDLENAVRNYGVTLGQVACRTTRVAELQKASLVMRAQSYRRRMFAEFEKVKELLLP